MSPNILLVSAATIPKPPGGVYCCMGVRTMPGAPQLTHTFITTDSPRFAATPHVVCPFIPVPERTTYIGPSTNSGIDFFWTLIGRCEPQIQIKSRNWNYVIYDIITRLISHNCAIDVNRGQGHPSIRKPLVDACSARSDPALTNEALYPL
jgi:hypothetical protein